MNAVDSVEVLLVEDEPAHAELIRRAFQSDCRHHLTIVDNLRDAWRVLEVMTPDVIIADLRLPDGEGRELLGSDSRKNRCPVLIMTSFGDQDIAVEIMRAGAADYIVKSEHALRDIPRAVGRAVREWRLIQARERALKEQARLIAILEATPDLIATADAQGQLNYMNIAGRALLGLGSEEDLSGIRLNDFHSVDDAHLIQSEGIPEAIRQGVWRAETNLVSRSRVTIPTSQVLVSHKNQQGEVEFFSTIVRDIRSVKEAEEKIEYLAFYDSLTGLPNRNELIRRLDVEVNRAIRHKQHGALLFIDLDNFKNINDSLGHPAGDKVLQELGLRLKTVIRGEDTVARLGGDEFVVILSGLSSDPGTAVGQAEEVSHKLQGKISLSINIGKLPLQLTASIGIAMFLDECRDAHELLRVADAAMYHAKAKGKNTLQVFNEGMDAHFGRFLAVESELRQAINKRQFSLYFQPKIMIGDKACMAGAEALIRWEHPKKGLVAPVEFLDILESSGMIIEVGNWVMEESFSLLSQWISRGIWRSDQRLSINISPRQFRDDRFVDRVVSALGNTGAVSSCIEMELTEQIVVQDVEETIAKMNALTNFGVSFSLDDFGTGYSSLSYLKQMPVSSMKIDRSFVRDITIDRNDQALVDTMLAMSRHLGMDAVAEGVETVEQLNLLLSSGCRLFQGYHFSPPLPVTRFEAFMDSYLAPAAQGGLSSCKKSV